MAGKCQFVSKSRIKPVNARTRFPHIAKSEENFHKQYHDAPRKIFMRPPCENETTLPNPAAEIIKACNHAVYTLKCRYYEELTNRQLVAIERVIELQGACELYVETLKSYSTLVTAILSKVSQTSGFSLYEQCLVDLMKIASRKVKVSTLTASFFESDHLRGLYDAIGLFIAKSPETLLHIYVPAVRDIVDYIMAEVARQSDTEFATCAREGFVHSAIIPALIDAYDLVRRDGTYYIYVLGIFCDILDFLPDSAVIVLENQFVNQLTDLLENFLSDPSEIFAHREPVFHISGLLLQLCATDPNHNQSLLEQNFAGERVIVIIYKMFQRYFLTVHDIDREIRNTFAAIIALLFEIALSSPAMADVLHRSKIVEWCIQTATRPELPNEHSEIGKLRLQMHVKDADLKCILLQMLIPGVRLLPNVDLRLQEDVMKSLLFYLHPVSSHKKSFWNATEYENLRITILKVLIATYPYLAPVFRDLDGSKILLSLLRGINGLECQEYFIAEQELKKLLNNDPQLNLRILVIRLIRTILESENTDEQTLVNFCIINEGIYALVQTMTSITQERDAKDFVNMLVMSRDILSALNYTAKTNDEIRDSVRKLAGHALLALMDLSIPPTKVDGADVIQCIFAAIATWIVGNEASEMQFIMGKGIERVIKIFQESPPELQKDLLSALENIMLQSFRISKYIEFLPHRQFLTYIRKLWTNEMVKPIIYSIYVLLCSSWDKMSEEDRSLLNPIGNYMSETFHRTIHVFVEKNGSLKPWILEEFRKLILLMRAGSVEGIPEPNKSILQNMGDCSKCLVHVLEETHQELSADRPFDSDLFKEGVVKSDNTAPRILYARSNNSLFAESCDTVRSMVDA